MQSYMAKLVEAARNQARYHRTRAELAQLPLDTRLDLDIYDVDETARKAVWG